MSSKLVHSCSGLALGAALGVAAVKPMGHVAAWMMLAGAMAGSSAPDWTEIAWHEGGGGKIWTGCGFGRAPGKRCSIIPHRTITHWMLAWVAISVLGLFNLYHHPESYVAMFGLAFVLSGLLHVMMDSRTPMGVPRLHPWKRTKPGHSKIAAAENGNHPPRQEGRIGVLD